MGRTGRVVAVLAIGWFLLVAPAAMAAPEVPVQRTAPVSIGVVLRQAPTPSGQQSPPASNQPTQQQPLNQRTTIGALGIVLIVLVLLSRKARGKPVFGNWKWKR